MSTSLHADIISFFVTRKWKYQKSENSMKIVNIAGKMRLLVIIIKVAKNQGFTLSPEDTFLEKPKGGGVSNGRPFQPFKG